MKDMHRIWPAIMVTCALLGGGSVEAHHSSAMFDYSHYLIVRGTIKSYAYQSPHVWISVLGHEDDGKSTGDAQQWDVEAVAPVLLTAMGITKDTFKPGDKVSIALYPLRDGRRAGALINITNAQGKTLGSKLPEKPNPATPAPAN